MTYRLASYPDASGGTVLMRHNDGSLTIMRGDPDGPGAYEPALIVPRFTAAPRGSAWKTPDTAQEAFALQVITLLNGAEEADRIGGIPAAPGLQPEDEDAG